MNTFTTVIADDEKLARELLASYVSKIPDLQVVATCSNAIEARFALQKYKPDILFLDIQMPDLTGLELLRMLPEMPATILTTAYADYAIESFEMDVIDYLLKPIEFERFFKSVSKAIDRIEKDRLSTTPATAPQALTASQDQKPTGEYIFVKSDYKIVKISIAEILYIEALQKYVRIHLPNDRVVTLISMSQLEEILPPNRFYRIHRSFIINMDKIEHIEGHQVRIGQANLQVSKGQWESFISVVRTMGVGW